MLKTTLILISVGALGTSLLAGKLMAPVPAQNRKENNLFVTVGGARRLIVKIPLGKVTLIADDSSTLKVHTVRTSKGPSDEQTRRWVNDSYLTAENKDGVLLVTDHPFGKNGLSDIGSDSERGKKSVRRSMDLEVEIHVPSTLAAKVNVSAGEADLAGRFRSLDAEVGAGSLNADRIRTESELTLKVGAGSVSAGIPSGSHSSGVITVGVGDVKLRIPGGSGADVSADVAMGEISGLPGKDHKEDGIHFGDHRHGRSGNGEAKVRVKVGTGNISIDSEGRVSASTLPEEATADRSDFKLEDSDIDMKIDSHLDKTIETAMAAATSALSSANMDFKIDLKDLKELDELKELKDFDGDMKDMHLEIDDRSKLNDHEMKQLHQQLEKAMKQVAESLKKMQPEIEKQMRASKPEIDRQMKEAQEQVAKAMKRMRPEMDKAMREVGPEIERAMKQAREEMARSSKEMKSIKPEIERAIREAMEELKRALKEMKAETKHTH